MHANEALDVYRVLDFDRRDLSQEQTPLRGPIFLAPLHSDC